MQFNEEPSVTMKTSFTLVLFFVARSTCAKLPSNFQKCTYGKSDFEECLANAVTRASALLTQPIKSVGLPNLAPLSIQSFSIGSGTGPVQVQQDFKDAKMFGLDEPKIHQASFSFENMVANITVEFARLEIRARYHCSGKVLLMPIQGEGNATLILKNLTALVYFPLVKVHKRGNTYLRIASAASIKLPKLDLLYVNFENLFNGNQQLGEALNKVINENWAPVFDDVRSGYEDLFTNIMTSIFNNFFLRVPLPEMMDSLDPQILL